MGEFVVTRCQPPKLFEPIEESLDQIACLVPVPVDVTLLITIAARRNDGLRAGRFDGCDQGVAVVALVRDDCFGGDGVDERRSLRDIGDLPAGQDQAQRIAQRIDAGVNLGT